MSVSSAHPTPTTTPLDTAPNLGPDLLDGLARLGARDRETLSARGAVDVWDDLRTAGLFDCIHSLLALEGAIRGVRWPRLDLARRAELRAHVAEAGR